eukprot:3696629-Pyramimonas_sp.AAC.1
MNCRQSVIFWRPILWKVGEPHLPITAARSQRPLESNGGQRNKPKPTSAKSRGGTQFASLHWLPTTVMFKIPRS